VTRALHIALFALALMLALTGAAGATELDDALASLRSAVAKHPDDPDVSWALADALEAAGRSDEAAQEMQRHLTRWPDRPAHGWRALGRCAYRAGAIDDAIAALSRALERDEQDAEAQLYYGLALQQQGENERAEARFEAAARDTELAPEALLLSGISHLGRGEQEGARARLERVIALAPRSESARDARALLDDMKPSRPAFSVLSYAGVQYDSNPSLAGNEGVAGVGSAQDDASFDFGTRFAWRPTIGGESRPFELGLEYERVDYADQSELAEQTFQGTATSLYSPHPRLAFRTDLSVGSMLVENDLYAMNGWARPNVFLELGPRAGVLRLYGMVERVQFENEPIVESLERSAWGYGAGAEQALRLGLERDAWFLFGGSYARRDTDGKRDDLGFGPAYDADDWRGILRVSGSLPFEIRGVAQLSFDAELYEHRNLIDALTEGPASPVRRRDLVWQSAFALRRTLYKSVELELHTEFTDRDSNVDLYGYQRVVTGLRLRSALP
jgi:tetratricopeptide (TPR) repeat protein